MEGKEGEDAPREQPAEQPQAAPSEAPKPDASKDAGQGGGKANDDGDGPGESTPVNSLGLKPPVKDKVIVRFRAAGNAPVMKQNKFKITASEKFQTVIDFLKKQLKFKPADSLFLYINQAFSPAPDEIVRNLYQCFEVDGKLDINYCTTPAWG
eukprot:Opistho-1_new@63381